MDRDKAKALIPVISAFANGEEIEVFDARVTGWFKHENPDWTLEPHRYRVVPSPTYRPYANADEFDSRSGEVLVSAIGVRYLASQWNDVGLSLGTDFPDLTWVELHDEFKFLDGSVCGIRQT